MVDKVRDLKEVVSEIPAVGAEIALGGFAITRCPIAFACELIRQNKREMTLYEIIGSMDADLLVGAGAVKSLSYGGGSLDRFGRLGRINEAIENGTIDVKEYSGLGLTLRFTAGSMGIPFIPTKAMLGTEIIQNLLKAEPAVKVGQSPFDGESYVFLGALQPEYSVIHCQYADKKGNVVTEGPVWDLDLAKAGRKLIVTVEKIVSTEYIKRFPEKVIIPGVYTYAVVEVPYGAYPTSVYKCYDYDARALKLYARINNNQQDFDEYLSKYVLGTKDHNEFIEQMGGIARLNSIAADPVFGYAWGGKNDGDD